MLLLTMALRIGQALTLRWEQIDLTATTIKVTGTVRRRLARAARLATGTKTTKARHLPLTPERLDAAMTRVKLPRLAPHGCRRTCATLLLGAGVPDRAIQDMLGHAKLTATMAVYAHAMTPSVRRRAMPRCHERPPGAAQHG